MSKQTTKPELKFGRKVVFKKEFNNPGVFESMYAAERWLQEHGYENGSLDYPNTTIAVQIGDYELPQKWRNINSMGRKMADGVIEFTVTSKATVYLFNLSKLLQQSDERI